MCVHVIMYEYMKIYRPYSSTQKRLKAIEIFVVCVFSVALGLSVFVARTPECIFGSQRNW